MSKFALVLALSCLAALPASAQGELADAREAYESGALGEAIERYEAVLHVPGNTRDALTEIHLHLGVLRAAMGERDAARAELELALALSPALEAPSELPPEDAAMFEALRRARAGPMRLVSEATSNREGAELTVRVEHAPANAVARVRVETALGVRELDAGGGSVALDAAALGPAREVRVSARDTFGGVLVEATVVVGSWVAPVTPAALPRNEPVVIASRGGEDLAENPWLWTGIALGVVAIASVILTVVLVQEINPGLGSPRVVGD